MVPALPPAARATLRDDLLALAFDPSEADRYVDVDEEARAILAMLDEEDG
jgi:hypothetical protein